jgi:hypothetical protein
LPDFPNNNSLKAFARRDQGPKRLHILVLSADGQTRRLSFSPSFFWILGFISVFILIALAYLAHQFVDLTLEKDYLGTKLDNVTKFNELRNYKETVAMAPEEARRILEILDRAIVMSESDEGEIGLIGVPEPQTEEVPPVDSPTDPPDEAVPPTTTTEVSDETPAETETDEFPVLDPLQAAWDVWHQASGTVTAQIALDIDDFEDSPSGNVTFVLRQDGQPGRRVKGRVLVVIALSDKSGKVTLVSAPATDLTKPEQAWEMGSKYNIVASKLVRAQAPIPQGSKILNAEVSSWDEDSKKLVFRKKILIEDK